MNKFINADSAGRKKAIQYITALTGITNTQFESYESPNGYDRTDLGMTAVTSANTIYYFEIECKDRYKYTSTDFDFNQNRRFNNNDGAMIEVNKFNDIIQLSKEKNKIPMYIMTYPDNVCLIFNLNKLNDEDIKIDKTIRSKTTINNDGSIKTNQCYYIDKNKAKVVYLGDSHLYSWEERLNKTKEENKLKLKYMN